MLAVSERAVITASARRLSRPSVSVSTASTSRYIRKARFQRSIHTTKHARAIDPATTYTAAACLAAGGGALGYWILSRVHIAKPNQFIIKTGVGIDNVDICKKTVQWPFQKVRFIDMTPLMIHTAVRGMSSEKIDLKLPFNFTISPKNDVEELKKYAVRFSEVSDQQMRQLVGGIMEGQARQLTANMHIEELFTGREVFKEAVKSAVQSELDQYGLQVDNINIAELDDTEGSNYFANRRKKILETTANEARISVAIAKKEGDIGEKENEAATRQRRAELESVTVKTENERKQQMEQSTKDLNIARIDFQRQVEIARAEGSAASEIRKADLEAEVQRKIALEQQERLRKDTLAPAIVQFEVEAKKAETERTKTIIAAEAARSQQAISAEADKLSAQLKAEAEAITVKTLAAAEAERIRAIAEASLLQDLKRAEGQLAIAQAQAQGFERLVDAFGGNSGLALTALMIEKGLIKDVAESQAKALQGLNPKITVWSSNGDEASQALRGVVQSIPPLLQTIKDQTGMDIFPQVFQNASDAQNAASAVAKAASK